MSTTVIYIGSKNDSEDFKKKYAHIDTLKIGSFAGLGRSDTYFDSLLDNLKASADSVGMVIFDQLSIIGVIGQEKAGTAFIKFAESDIRNKIDLVILDSYHQSSETGRQFFNERGIKVINDIVELGPVFDIAADKENKPEEPIETADANEETLPDNQSSVTNANFEPLNLDKTKVDPFSSLAETPNNSEEEEDYDPFADELFSATPIPPMYPNFNDPFASYNNDYYQNNDPNDWQTYPQNIMTLEDLMVEIDPFANYMPEEQTQQPEPFQKAPDPFVQAEPAMYDDLTEGFSGHLTQEDLNKLLKAVEPNWDYSQINEAVNKKGLGGSKKGLKMGEVDSSSMMSSDYIRSVEDVNGFYYPPDESKLICVYAPIGGCGKTTIATMIAAQLNWYFNRRLMMGQTTSQNARILCLSLNEFDDISVKEIGFEDPLYNDNNGKNIAELKKRIEECDGEPEWDDISHCFAASPKNYVFYLPALTLKEKFEADIDITADDYKKIVEVCSRFFQFIVLDTPDIFYDHRHGVVELAFNASDIIVFIMEPDVKSTINIYRLFDGWASNKGMVPLDPEKCMLIVNKYVTKGNPYAGFTNKTDENTQIPYDKIVKSTAKYFKCAHAIPLTEYRSSGNILFGKDPKVKQASAEITDSILQMIDENDDKASKAARKK